MLHFGPQQLEYFGHSWTKTGLYVQAMGVAGGLTFEEAYALPNPGTTRHPGKPTLDTMRNLFVNLWIGEHRRGGVGIIHHATTGRWETCPWSKETDHGSQPAPPL